MEEIRKVFAALTHRIEEDVNALEKQIDRLQGQKAEMIQERELFRKRLSDPDTVREVADAIAKQRKGDYGCRALAALEVIKEKFDS